MNILVVEDEEQVRDLVRGVLERDAHHVTAVRDGAAGLAAAAAQRFDVVILDVHLTDMSGFDVLEKLRTTQSDPHVIMLTGAGSEAERVFGLVSGADDYVVKPFSPRELAARLHAVGRRRADSQQAVLLAEDICIDLDAREVTVREERVTLTRRELDLLVHLVSNPRQTFSRGDLLEVVWGSSPDWQSEATVTEHVRRLRAKIERDPAHPRRIVTVQRAGYLFDPGVTDAVAAEPAPERADEAALVVIDRKVVHATEAAASLLGFPAAEEMLGRMVLEFIAPMSQAASGERRGRISVGDWPRPELMMLVRADGREVLVELGSRPVTWVGSPATRVIMRDLGVDTTRVRQVATGVHTEVGDAVVISDVESRILSVNAAAEDLYGWQEGALIGRYVEDAIPWYSAPPEPSYGDVRAEVERSGRWHGTVRRGRRDRSEVRVNSSISLIRSAGGRPAGLVSVARPIERAAARWSSEVATLDDELAMEIRGAAARGELRLHYQPVVVLETGDWVGVEALVRWEHPTRGLLQPAQFIALAERSGEIPELGDWVLREACAQSQRWRSEGRNLYISVNVAPPQLADDAFAHRLVRLIEDTNTPPGTLWLEVTETSLVQDVERARVVLERIAQLGVRVVIDDFGTGWASLTYLHAFPVHGLKIDRSFVEGVATNPTDVAIVSSILSLGHELDLAVIAEGVETSQQEELLQFLGCQFGQGHRFGVARTAVDLLAAQVL